LNGFLLRELNVAINLVQTPWIYYPGGLLL